MSTSMSPEITGNNRSIYSPTWRIVPETDSERASKPFFTPIRQTIFWLRTGQNPNKNDSAQVRKPFVTHLLSKEEQTAFERGFVATQDLYKNRFVTYTTDEKDSMVVGDYTHQTRGIPVVTVVRTGEKMYVLHEWVSVAMREKRLR